LNRIRKTQQLILWHKFRNLMIDFEKTMSDYADRHHKISVELEPIEWKRESRISSEISKGCRDTVLVYLEKVDQ
jgi:hypothetical protein